jgi:hypothetical protein
MPGEDHFAFFSQPEKVLSYLGDFAGAAR